MAMCRTAQNQQAAPEPKLKPERQQFRKAFEIIGADTLRLTGRGVARKPKSGSKAEAEAEQAARRDAVRDLVKIFGPYCSQLEYMVNSRGKKENELMKLMKINEKDCRVTEDGTVCKVSFLLKQQGIQERVEIAERDLTERQKQCLMM